MAFSPGLLFWVLHLTLLILFGHFRRKSYTNARSLPSKWIVASPLDKASRWLLHVFVPKKRSWCCSLVITLKWFRFSGLCIKLRKTGWTKKCEKWRMIKWQICVTYVSLPFRRKQTWAFSVGHSFSLFPGLPQIFPDTPSWQDQSQNPGNGCVPENYGKNWLYSSNLLFYNVQESIKNKSAIP